MTRSLQEKVVCLVSGGIDSPVAAYFMMRKGCIPVFVYFDNSPFTDETTRQKAIEAIRRLKQFTPDPSLKVYIVPHGANLADILRSSPRNLTCVLCRRMMYRSAARIALKEHAKAIVTGEIIGEHASQTLRNLRVISQAATDISVHRPLAGMNKTEVENFARKIGTLDASTKPASCCTGPPPEPRTRARFDEVLKAEAKLDLDAMVERSFRGSSLITI